MKKRIQVLMLKHDQALRQGRLYNLDEHDARRLVAKGAAMIPGETKPVGPSEVKPIGPAETKATPVETMKVETPAPAKKAEPAAPGKAKKKS